MYYSMIIFASLLFSVQFMFTGGYSKDSGSSWRSVVVHSFYGSVAGIIFALLMNKFHFEFSFFSLGMAAISALNGFILSNCSIKVLEKANLSVYSMFMMLGGMILPVLYGIIFGGEELTIMRIICIVLITLALFTTIEKGKQSKSAVIYYIIVFVLNGMAGVISTIHQSHLSLAVDSYSYTILSKIITIVFCVAAAAVGKFGFGGISKKSLGYIGGSSVFNTFANILLLIALLHLDASLQYPLVTGFSIIFSTLIDFIRGVKVSKRVMLGAIFAFGATIMMAF